MVLTTTSPQHKSGIANIAPSAIVAGTVAAVAILFCAQANAAEWRLKPSVEVAETYTDNLRLTPEPTQQSDFVTQISPGLALSGIGRGLKVKADYVMQNLIYARYKNGMDTNNSLNAQATAEVLEDIFFLDGRASVGQQNASAFGAVSTNNLNPTNNRTDVRTKSISPYLQHRFGQWASAQLRYSYDTVDTNGSSSSLSNTQTDRVRLVVNSGPAFKTLGWGLQYNKQNIHYSNALPFDMESYSGNLNYFLTPRLTLTATAGYERNSYFSIGDQPSGAFWMGGVSWEPSSRSKLTASAGKRFFGDTYSLTASHRARNTIWSVGYNEDITTTQSQFAVPVTINTANFLDQLWENSIPDAQTRAQMVDAFIKNTGLPVSLAQSINTFTNSVFLQKNAQASVAINGVRNTVLVSLFNTRREAQSAVSLNNQSPTGGLLGLEDNTLQTGLNAVWNVQLSARTSANVSAGYTEVNSHSTGRKDHNKTARFALTRQFQPKLRGMLELRRLQHDSNASNSDYRENAFTASLLMGF